jgi:hypothetical protein
MNDVRAEPMTTWIKIQRSMERRAYCAAGQAVFDSMKVPLEGASGRSYAIPDELIAWLRNKRASREKKQAIYKLLVEAVRKGDAVSETALVLIWLGLYPGLHHRYWLKSHRFGHDQPVPFILSAFYRQIRKINLAKSKNLAATIVMNTVRSAIFDVQNRIGNPKRDIYRKRRRNVIVRTPAHESPPRRDSKNDDHGWNEGYDAVAPWPNDYGHLGATPSAMYEGERARVGALIRAVKPQWADLLIELILDDKKPSKLARKYRLDERSIRKRLEKFAPKMLRHLSRNKYGVNDLRRERRIWAQVVAKKKQARKEKLERRRVTGQARLERSKASKGKSARATKVKSKEAKSRKTLRSRKSAASSLVA